MISSRPARTKAEKAALRRLHDHLRARADAAISAALIDCPITQREGLLRSIIFAGSDRLAITTCPVSTASLLCSAAARVSPDVRVLTPQARASALFTPEAQEVE